MKFSGSIPLYNHNDFKKPIMKGRKVTSKSGIERDCRVRILRPKEFDALLRGCRKTEYRTMFQALLYTGARYIEIQRLQDHPEWFDGEVLYLPFESMKKRRTQLERYVRLNQTGRTILEYFLRLDKKLPTYQSWSMNMKRWAEHVGLDPLGLSAKTTRKTYESWLMFYYPNQIPSIALSQGHTQLTSLQHYINLPFNESDRFEMRKYVEGWI